jgi:hypothetical protein
MKHNKKKRGRQTEKFVSLKCSVGTWQHHFAFRVFNLLTVVECSCLYTSGSLLENKQATRATSQNSGRMKQKSPVSWTVESYVPAFRRNIPPPSAALKGAATRNVNTDFFAASRKKLTCQISSSFNSRTSIHINCYVSLKNRYSKRSNIQEKCHLQSATLRLVFMYSARFSL